MKRVIGPLLLGLLTASSPALAQPAMCELHVWPVRSPSAPAANLLSPSSQALAASTLDLLSLFGMGPGMVLFESDIITPAKLNNPHRLLAETPACDAELILTANQFAPGSLKTDFTFRDFRTGQMRVVRGSAASPLHSQAQKDVSAAFAANLRTIAGQTAQPRR